MMTKQNGFSLMVGHDVHEIFEEVFTPEAFAALKVELSRTYPELASLSCDTKDSWVKQAAEKLKIPYDTLQAEIESQMLREYLIKETYKNMLHTINDPEAPMSEKEKIAPGIEMKVWDRQFRTVLYGVAEILRFTLINGALAALIMTAPMAWMNFAPLMVLNYFLGAFLIISYFMYFRHPETTKKIEEKIENRAYNILAGGE